MKRTRFLWQMFFSHLVVTLISLIAVTWYATLSIEELFLDRITSDLTSKAILVERLVNAHLALPAKVDESCKELGKKIATRITIILPSGKVIGDSEEDPLLMDDHSRRPEISAAIKEGKGVSIRFSTTIQKDMMYVAMPVLEGKEVAAVIRTSIPLTAAEKFLAELYTKIFFVGGIIAVLAVIFSLVTSRRMSLPLEKMKEGAEQFAKGNFNIRLPRFGTVETEKLAKALNLMAVQLEERFGMINQQRKELDAVLSGMSEGVIAVNNQRNIFKINSAAAELFNIDSDKVLFKSVLQSTLNLELDNFITAVVESQSTQKDEIILTGEKDRFIEVHGSLLTNEEQQSIGAVIVLNDITHLKRLENMRREFVANVSHELKTPITSIKGFVETLRDGAMESVEESRRFLHIIDKHVDRLIELINDLLNLSRIEEEEQKQKIAKSEIALQPFLEKVIESCKSKAEEKKISLRLLCEEKLLVKIDSSLFELALVNLLNNAIDYSPPEKTITLNVLKGPHEIRFQVIDQGSGIAKEHLDRIFERFYRVDRARSRKLGGTGLGLAIVKHIAQAHGGRVEVQSEPQKGSTFTIHLPYRL